MVKKFAFLSVFLVLITLGCSDTDPKKDQDDTEQVEEPKKPLLERDVEAKEYLELVGELTDQYLTLGEDFLGQYESFEKGDMDTFEKIGALGELTQDVLKIEELSAELSLLEQRKSTIEKKMDADDLIEFGLLFNEKMERFNALYERIQKTDFSSLSLL